MSGTNSPKPDPDLALIKETENASTEKVFSSIVDVDIASVDDLEIVDPKVVAKVENLVDFNISERSESVEPVVNSLTESPGTPEDLEYDSSGPVADTDSIEEKHETVDAKSEGIIEIDDFKFSPKLETQAEARTFKPSNENSPIHSPNEEENSFDIDDISLFNIPLESTIENAEDKPNNVMTPEEENKVKSISSEADQSASDVTDTPAEESVTVLDNERPTRGKKVDKRDRKNSSPNEDTAARLEQELEQEMRYRDTVMWSVGVLQQSVKELEEQMEALNREEEDREDSEFKLRCRAQTELNKKLEEQISWYNGEVLKIRDRLKKGQDYTYDADLDEMSEFELAKLVKDLERQRNNLYGDLRSKSWLLDSQSKDYYHNKELIKAYTGDLNHINRSLEHFWRQRNREKVFTGGATPMTSPGSIKWNGEEGIQPSQRIIDPRKGPIRKTAGVRSLPRLDQEALEYYDTAYTRKRRTKSMTSTRSRTKSVDAKRKMSTRTVPRSEDSTSAEPTSEQSEDFTVESFTSSGM